MISDTCTKIPTEGNFGEINMKGEGDMKLLPSEALSREKSIIEEIKSLKEGERIQLSEPCDCGSHIRHNNGGNYHDEITIALDGGQYYRRDDSTCELTEPAEWFPVSLEELIACAKGFAEAGM